MMEKQIINRIQNALNYVEDNLYEKIEIEEIAKIAFMSQSSFYLVFSSILGTTVKDYIRKRRLSLSAYDLIRSDLGVLEIALKYQYCTSESYSRSFKNLFGIAPKQYKEKNLYTNVFPRVTITFQNLFGGNLMINREMNKDLITQKIKIISNGYILDIDIDNFDNINKTYGYNIGDKVLIEVPRRIKIILNSYNMDIDVTRVNGDEFAVIVKDESKDFIEKLSNDIINAMSPEFIFDKLAVNLTVSIGISDFIVDCDDEKVIKNANNAMILAKRNGRNQYKMSEGM
jgi:AraC family transcriptional regulator